MALSFGLKVNCRVNLSISKDELPGVAVGSLTSHCVKEGIFAFVAEVRESERWEEANVIVSQKGIENVLRFLGMLDGVPELIKDQIVIPRRRSLRCRKGGFAELLIKPGDICKEGDCLLGF